MKDIIRRIREAKGLVGAYYCPLDGGCALMFNEDLPLHAASVIKLTVMVEAFRQMEAGELEPSERHILRDAEKLPSCGALNRLHDGLELTIRDLVELMIVLSDNSATNILIDRLGIERINETIRSLGFSQTVLRRKMFDAAGHAAGIENTVSAREMGVLLEKIYRGSLISPEADRQMLEILKSQRLNGKMPFYLHSHGIAVAHKTGEDDGISHDVGIVLSPQPYVLCMLSNDTDVPQFERLIQDTARVLCGIDM